MTDGTTLLFALPGFRVLDVTAEADGGRLVTVEVKERGGGCPSCGVISERVHDRRPVRAVRDLPHGRVPLRVRVVGRRLRCLEAACPRWSFTQVSRQLPLRARVTDRLQAAARAAVTHLEPGGLRRRRRVRVVVADGAPGADRHRSAAAARTRADRRDRGR